MKINNEKFGNFYVTPGSESCYMLTEGLKTKVVSRFFLSTIFKKKKREI